ncbi:MAG: tetratricopeptide repeat protein, partial [Deltaproteobacteria bacterium]|nr:tetratricopeptide repeat protein [Deltaproteobacteria bacterium]
TWIGHAHLGLVRRRMGALAEAEARYRTAIEIIETEYGPLHPDLFTLRGNLGNVLFDRGQRKAALQQFERALEAIDGASERDNLRRVMLLVRIGATHMMLGELDQAEPRYQQALETLRRMDAMGGVIAAEAMHNYALLEQRRGHIDRAVSLYEGALEIRRELDGQRQATVNTLINLGVIESERGRLEQAEAWARQALALATEHFPEAGPVRADAEGAMGKVLLRRGRPEQSLRHLERALASQRSLEAPAHERARLVLWIARARTANDEARDRVRPAVEEALREVRAMPEPDRKLEGELVTWIEGGSGVP